MDTVDRTVARFIDLAAANGATAATLNWYHYMLLPVLRQHGQQPIDGIDNDAMIACVQAIRARGVGVETVRSHIRVMHQFWRWATKEYRLPRASYPMRGIKRPPRPKPAPRAISAETLSRLLGATDDTPTGKRARAIFLLLASSGIRVGGLISLRPADVNLLHCTAVVTEKGAKTRHIYFTVEAAEAIRAWLDVRPASADTLFCSMHRGHVGSALTPSGVRIMIGKLARKAGIPKGERINPHSFRHYFALQAKKAGMPIAVLAGIIGHEDPAFTLRTYGALSQDEIAESYRQFSGVWEGLYSERAAR
jgi:integrase/recombinase XerC